MYTFNDYIILRSWKAASISSSTFLFGNQLAKKSLQPVSLFLITSSYLASASFSISTDCSSCFSRAATCPSSVMFSFFETLATLTTLHFPFQVQLSCHCLPWPDSPPRPFLCAQLHPEREITIKCYKSSIILLPPFSWSCPGSAPSPSSRPPWCPTPSSSEHPQDWWSL